MTYEIVSRDRSGRRSTDRISGFQPGDTGSIPVGRTTESPALTYLSNLALGSRRAQYGALETISQLVGRCGAREMPWHELTASHIGLLRGALQERYAPATVNRHLAALRGVLKESWRAGLIGVEQLARLTDFRPCRGSTLPTGRLILDWEMQAILSLGTFRDTALVLRDVALFAVAYATGARRAELVAFDLADHSNSSLKVRAGKGNKQRMVWVKGRFDQILKRWLQVRGDEDVPLFVAIGNNGRPVPRRLHVDTVSRCCARLSSLANVAPFTPHDIRRTYASTLLSRGVDIASVARLMGHSSTRTTQRYDLRPQEALERAAEVICDG